MDHVGLAVDAYEVEAIVRALTWTPNAAENVLRHLAEAVLRYRQTADPGHLEMFAAGLLATADLHSDEARSKELRGARSDDRQPSSLPLADVITRLRA